MIVISWRPVLFVFLPLAAGYFLSYFFRTINALIAGSLVTDLGVDASHLGLMTSVYFLTFAAVQLPLGVLLDRYGPRRVQSGLLLIAASGAALFAAADRFEVLVIGRALIGFGVAGSLIAGLKAIVLWFPKERLSLFNGCFIMLGTLGAVVATSPTEWVLAYTGWRGLLDVLAITTAATALVIFLVVPDIPQRMSPAPGSPSGGLNGIYRDPRFWRIAPLSAICISTAWAVQGLWAGPWLADVDGLNRAEIVRHLFVMAVALSATALLLGIGADRLRSRGVRPQNLFCCVAILFVCAELMLILDFRSFSYTLWAVVAGVGGATVLSYSILAEYFSKEIAAQANAALNVFHIGGAFLLQEVMGWVIDRWPDHAGHYPSLAYKTALALIVILQVIAILWFVRLDRWLVATILGTFRPFHKEIARHAYERKPAG